MLFTFWQNTVLQFHIWALILYRSNFNVDSPHIHCSESKLSRNLFMKWFVNLRNCICLMSLSNSCYVTKVVRPVTADKKNNRIKVLKCFEDWWSSNVHYQYYLSCFCISQIDEMIFFTEMFKKFEEKENVSSVQQLKSSVQKGIVMIQFFLQYCSWKTRQLHYDRRPVFDIDVWCGVRLFRHFLVIATYNDG